jgi:hypothetical protein
MQQNKTCSGYTNRCATGKVESKPQNHQKTDHCTKQRRFYSCRLPQTAPKISEFDKTFFLSLCNICLLVYEWI